MISKATLAPTLVIAFHATSILALILTPMGIECKTQRLVLIVLGNTTFRQIQRPLTSTAFPLAAFVLALSAFSFPLARGPSNMRHGSLKGS